MAGQIKFFDTTNPLASALSANWKVQNGGNPSTSTTRESELGGDGDEILSGLHDRKTSASWVYVLEQKTGRIVFPKCGVVVGGWHIDRFTCAWANTQIAPKLTVQAHRHDTGNAHGAEKNAQGRTYTCPVEVYAQDFGVPTSFGDAFSLKPSAVVDTRSATLTFGVSHQDELGHDGNELAGNSHDGACTLQVDLTGEAEASDYETSWDVVSNGTTPSNTGATTSSVNVEKHVGKDAAAAA